MCSSDLTGVSTEMQRGMEPALEYYRRAYALDPHNVDLGVNIAKALIGRRQFTEAQGVLQHAATANPKSAEPLFWLGVVQKTNDQVPAAVDSLRRALKLDPQHINGVHLLTEIYLQQTNATELVKLLDQSYRQNSPNADYWVRIGDLYTMSAKQMPALTNQLGSRRRPTSGRPGGSPPPEGYVGVRATR